MNLKHKCNLKYAKIYIYIRTNIHPKKKNTTIAALLGFYLHLFVTVYSVLFVTDIHKNQASFQYSIGI